MNLKKKREVRKQKGAEDGMKQLTVLEMISRIESKSTDNSTGKDEPEVDRNKVEIEKKIVNKFHSKLDLEMGFKTANFRKGGQDPKEGNILHTGGDGTTKTTLGDGNVFHVPSDDKTPDGFSRKGKNEEKKKLPIATAKNASSL